MYKSSILYQALQMPSLNSMNTTQPYIRFSRCWLFLVCLLSILWSLSNPSYASQDGLSLKLAVREHPRSLDVVSLRANRALIQALAERRRDVIAYPQAVEPEGDLPSGAGALAERWRKIQAVASGEEDKVLRLALSALVLGDEAVIQAAKQRALRLASWAPRGATGFFNQDQSGRSVAWTLALAYDWLFEYWNADEKRVLLSAIRPRVEDMLSPPVQGRPTGWAGLDWGRKLDRSPYDSHGVTTMARLSVICVVLAGEDILFDQCARQIVPRYLSRPIPWGGRDGGFSNGTAYAHWGLLDTHFVVWQMLISALGSNPWQGEWAQGYLNFITYFLPPGAPTGLFGDAAEKRFADVWATQAKTYAAHLPSPLADWYARNQFGENPAHMALQLAPVRDWNVIPGALPAKTPHAVHLADIGWVAMHSDLGDRTRTSVYFKSSPYGSFNHSHADQNSFVIHARGRALAIDSGYYDYYGSPHWKDWYKQTRAHNAITFDGGQGQSHDTMKAKGKITSFEHHAEYDIATGDAVEAYDGALTRAVRSIVYLRPGTVLVYDSLASDTPRTWEWNLHSLSRMKESGKRVLEIDQDGVRLCATLLEAPEGAFAQTDRFTTEPQGKYPAQWHARYATRGKSQQASFLAVLDVDCQGAEATVQRVHNGLDLGIAGRRVTFDSTGHAGVTP